MLAQRNDWGKSEIARRAAVPLGTFSAWYDGSYTGRFDTQTAKVETFLAAVLDAAALTGGLPTDPGLVQTRITRKLFDGFTYAQQLPTISVMTLAAGLGKSIAARQFQAISPHVYHVTMSPSSARPHVMMTDIAEEIGIDTANSARLKGAIRKTLKRPGFDPLLITDEARNLGDECINELRHFRDMANCGLVLLGNNETTTPCASADVRHNSPQVARRVGHRLTVMQPYAEDVTAILDAWDVTDEGARTVATAIAAKPGAFGSLVETIKAGSMIARGQSRPLSGDHLKMACERRGGGAV